MKKTLLRLGLLASMTLTLFSCDKEVVQHQNLVPKDFDLILTVNPAQIAEKAQISSEENAKLINSFAETVFDSRQELSDFKAFFKNPELSGIDGDAPIYTFMDFDYSEGKEEAKVLGLSCKLKDADKFKAFALDDSEGTFKFTKSELAGFEVFKEESSDEPFYIAVKDNEALVYMNPSGGEEALKAILEQKAEDSFASTKLFAKMNETQEDFECVLNYAKVAEKLSKIEIYRNNDIYKESVAEARENLPSSGVYYMFSLNSEQGALSLLGEVYAEDEKYKEMIQSFAQAIPVADGTFLNKLPKNSLYAFNFALKGDKLWETILKYYPKTIAKVEEESQEDFAELGVSFADLVKAFDGDVAFSVGGSMADFQNKQIDIRSFVQLANEEAIIKLLDKGAETSDGEFSKLGEGQYSLRGSFPLSLSVKDKVLALRGKVVDNAEELLQDADPSIKESSFANQLEGQRVVGVLNLSAMVEVLKPFMGLVLTPKAIELTEEFDYLSLSSGENSEVFEAILKLKHDKNPYALLMDFAREVNKK